MPKTRTPAELTALADRILKRDRKKKGSAAADFSLQKARDLAVKAQRRDGIMINNAEQVRQQTSPEYSLTPEELIIRNEEEALVKSTLLRILIHFEDDYIVKQIIVAVTVMGVDFHSTRALAKECAMTVKQAHSAKERLKYFVLKDKTTRQAKITSK